MSGVCENEKVFGSAHARSYPPEELDTEFKKKYPPDPFGEEMAPNARVWNIYRDEAMAQDESMLDGWNKTLDILLIFAGLFSALATAFIVESYRFLQPDFEEYTARALFLNYSCPLATDPASSTARKRCQIPPLSRPRTSLAGSMGCGLLACFCRSLPHSSAFSPSSGSASTRHASWHKRVSPSLGAPPILVLYFDGMRKWHLRGFISILPLLLHLSVFLFLAGLELFIWGLDASTAWWLLMLTASLAVFYLGCFVLPAWWIDCPSSTPLLLLILSVIDRLLHCANQSLWAVSSRPIHHILVRQTCSLLKRYTTRASCTIRVD